MSERPEELRDWPFRESAALRPPREEAVASETEVEAEVPPEPEAELAEPGLVLPEPVVEEPVEEPGEVPVVEEAVEGPIEEPEEELVEAPEEVEHAPGEFRVPGGYTVMEGAPKGGRRSVAIVVSRFNGEITNRLLESALEALEEAGVAKEAILVMPVPGAFELPLAAMALAKTRRYACVVALGCVIRGETPHFDFVAGEAASGLQLAAIDTGVPVAFGLLTTNTREQAEERVGRGAESARTALEMADLFARLRATAAAAAR
jgi:6,7-dimethyl-8-ribityllumazine synthase